jgi:glutamate dehydrogenase (NADP+)
MLESYGLGFEGKSCIVGGSTNIAIYTMEKLISLGAKVIACSDRSGVLIDKNGVDVGLIKQIKEVDRGSLAKYSKLKEAEFCADKKITGIACDYAFSVPRKTK